MPELDGIGRVELDAGAEAAGKPECRQPQAGCPACGTALHKSSAEVMRR
jgi:hypothetical protein